MAKKKNIPIKKLDVDFVPKDPFYDTILGKILSWALSVGRYIVVFTELVVILSFLSRFQLDRQVTDLNGELMQKQSIIESYGSLENDVREVQKKIETYKQLKTRKPIKEIFTTLSAVTPQGIEYTTLSLKSSGLRINGIAQSTNALSQFLYNIQIHPEISNVVVQKIVNRDKKEPGFEFELEADIHFGTQSIITKK